MPVAEFSQYLVGVAIYDLYGSPLAQYPGPKSWACSRLPYLRALQKGDLVHRIKELHDRHGDVVRIAPDEISFINAKAFRDIYGVFPGHKEFPKNSIWMRPQVNGVYSIHGANDADHARMRRLLAHAFSDKVLRQQEPIFQSYVNLLVRRLHEKVSTSASLVTAIDIGKWYDFTTFDITGDLSFGESFHCLEESTYHPWVSILFSSFKAAALFTSCRYIPGMESLMRLALPKSVRQRRKDHFHMIKAKVDHRIENRWTDERRNDFMAYVLRYNDEKGMTVPEIEATIPFLVLAGSETTATTLAGVTNCLVNNPEVLQRLVNEIRGSFARQEEITFESISKLPYLGAVIEEGLRICAPVALGSPRTVPAGGSTVDGHWLPGGVSLSCVSPCISFSATYPLSRLFCPLPLFHTSSLCLTRTQSYKH